MKMDKDTLVKHHFWIVLGGALVVTLAALFMLRSGVRGEIGKRKDEVKKKLEGIASAASAGVKSEGEIKKLEAQAKESEHAEAQIWRTSYALQEDFLRWSPEVEAKFKFSRNAKGEIGFFATAIVIEPGAELTETSQEDGDTFKGIVEAVDDMHVKLKGKVKRTVTIKPKEGEPEVKEVEEERELVFYNTPQNKVMQGGKREIFANINVGQLLTVTYHRGRYFYDPLTQQERTEFAESYDKQFESIFEIVDPVDEDGKGVVQLRMDNGFWPFKRGELPPAGARFMHVVDKAQLNPVQDFSELAWLAQEDIWVYRELYRLVDQSNSYVREFTQTEKEKANPKVWVGRNAYWQVEIAAVDADHVAVKLSNLLGRRQALGVVLKVWYKDAPEPERLSLGEAGPRDARGGPNDSKVWAKLPLTEGVPRGPILKVEQELNWELAAVKRIDDIIVGSGWAGAAPTGGMGGGIGGGIGIGLPAAGSGGAATAHSHRTFPIGLKPYREEKKPEGVPVDGGMGMGDMPPGGRPDIVPKGGTGGADAGDFRKRYIEVKPGSRRIPVAVTLIVDQQHVDRVLTSFANSHLRFLPTQVLMNRYPYSVNPFLNKKDPGGMDMPMGFPAAPVIPVGPRGPMGSPGGSVPMADPPRGDGAFGGGGGEIGAALNVNDEREANVELVIYGIVTLYERYPLRTVETPAP